MYYDEGPSNEPSFLSGSEHSAKNRLNSLAGGSQSPTGNQIIRVGQNISGVKTSNNKSQKGNGSNMEAPAAFDIDNGAKMRNNHVGSNNQVTEEQRNVLLRI